MTVLTEKPHIVFSNFLYFVCDLFLSIACRISMHSTLGVITSHPVSSPWLHLSSLHLFSMCFFFPFPLISCVHPSLPSICLSVSLFVTHAHTSTQPNTTGQITQPYNYLLLSPLFFNKLSNRFNYYRQSLPFLCFPFSCVLHCISIIVKL